VVAAQSKILKKQRQPHRLQQLSVYIPRPLALRDMRRCVEPPALVGEGPSLSSPSRESLSKPALGGPFCAVSRLITFVKAVWTDNALLME
jgi:hypothetical protein